MAVQQPDDVDLSVVLEALRGARRAPNDPDFDVALILGRLQDPDEDELRKAVQELVRSAHSD